MPAADQWPARLPGVLNAIYGAYGLGWSAANSPDDTMAPAALAGEAIGLARLLAAQRPEPEELGLLALMLWCESRRGARCDAVGDFVPLGQQDVARWDCRLMDEAACLLARASQAGQPGRYQLEAAVQPVHARRAGTGQTDWQALALLYQGLLNYSLTLG